MTLRVNLYGNVCNNAYVIGKFLRALGVDAHLFLERGFPWLPEHEDPELASNYPDWIHLTGDLRWLRYGPFDREFLRLLGDCDIIHTLYYGPIWARKAGRPFVFQPYGGDLNVLPFMTDSLHHRYLASRQRRGIVEADMVFLTNPNVSFCKEALRRLRLTRIAYMPLPVDADRFRPLPEVEVKRARDQYDSECIFFHPPRQIWTESSAAWERKGNDRVFRAFARFLRDTKRQAQLIAVKHGPDLQASQRLVQDLGIEQWVQWIPPQQRHELIRFYNLSDAVIDQFVLGDYGGCAFEAWACGKPVLIYLESCREMFREDPPTINVRTEDEIYRKLIDSVENPDAFREIGMRARQWVLENLHGAVLVKRYISTYEQILESRRARMRLRPT